MRAIALGMGCLIASVAGAEEFNFEVIGSYESISTEVTSVINFGGLLLPDPIVRSETEADEFSAGFRWYFDGLSDEIGPRASAPFTNRASFVGISAVSGSLDFSGSITNDPNAPSFSESIDFTGITVAGRKVFDRWFVFGAATLTGFDGSQGQEFDQDSLRAGAGRYIGQTTALSLSGIRVSSDDGLDDDVDSGLILAFNHVGDFGAAWQYGIDLSVSNQSFESSSGTYSSTFSLFPDKDLSLSLDVTGQLGSSALDATGITLEAGWFVTPQLQLEFAIGTTIFDDPDGTDSDADAYRLQASYRF